MTERITVRFTIDGEAFDFEAQGEFARGPDEVLFDPSIDLLYGKPWGREGFVVVPLLAAEEYRALRANVTREIAKLLRRESRLGAGESFELEHYHELVDDRAHYAVVGDSKKFSFSDLGWDRDELARKFGQRLGLELSPVIPKLERDVIQVRINRPRSTDFNPPHRDGHFSYLRNTLNVWVPVAGCNERSSLPLIPGSHWWNEATITKSPLEGGIVNGNRFRVPCIVAADAGLKMVRPNPAPGEALVFTPYMIHGAAVNDQADRTRVALEFRFTIRGQRYPDIDANDVPGWVAGAPRPK